MCVCMHARTFLVKVMKMFFCTVFLELSCFIFHKDIHGKGIDFCE